MKAIACLYWRCEHTLGCSPLDPHNSYPVYNLPDILQNADGAKEDESSHWQNDKNEKFDDDKMTFFKNETVWVFEFFDVDDVSKKEGKNPQRENQRLHRWRHDGKNFPFSLFH